jgi:exodeoxyribonuclease-3
VLRVATANVNGVRAAARRGMGSWLAARRPDVLCLQEVRAGDDELAGSIGPGWHGVHEESPAKGRAGVAVLSRTRPMALRGGLDGFVGSGRWVEADYALTGGPEILTVASVYVHTGEAETDRQVEKHRFLDQVLERLEKLAADGRHVLVCGDFNIAHREADLKNWKGNLKKSGFLPEERAWVDRLVGGSGYVDVLRSIVGDGPGPYTWWSWRGKAFDADTGWRIDYQFASAGLAALAVDAEIDRATRYADRWSDHAPLVVDFDVRLVDPSDRPDPVSGPHPE